MSDLFVQWYDSVFYGKTYWETVGIWLFDFYLWIPLLYFFISQMVLPTWLLSRRIRYAKKQKYIYLAIDAPKKNEQSIIGIELALIHILGAESAPNMKEKWIEGMYQLSMSLEIVSIDGFIQLVVRCPKSWRDLVESAFYAQYPDCEITEIEDYTHDVPHHYPNPTHNMWGVEWVLTDKCLPIRTHLEFEDKLVGTTVDPLAGLLEAMSKIGKGEQIWFQILCVPIKNELNDECKKMVDKMTGQEPKHAHSFLADIGGFVETVIGELLSGIGLFGASAHAEEHKKDDAFGAIWKMSPGDRENLEMLQKKMRKPAYAVKLRYGYFGEHKVFNKPRGVQAIIGAVKQFNSMGRNGLKPEMKHSATKAAYFYVKKRIAFRQNKLVHALMRRDVSAGMPAFKMNVEEIATMFHFPGILVKAPMLKRTVSLKREAPSNLPFGEMPDFEDTSPEAKHVQMLPAEGAAAILPEDQREVIESPKYSFDYDNDEFEKRFAIKKTTSQEEESKKVHAQQHAHLAEEELARKVAPIVKASDVLVEEAAPAVLPATHEEPASEILDLFAGSKAIGKPDASFPAQIKTEPVDHSHEELLKSLPKRPKRYDPEKDIPSNLPFVD